MGEDNDVRINFDIDEETREQAKTKLDHGELSERLRDHVRKIAWGEELSERERLQSRLQSLRTERDKTRAQIRRLQADVEEKETEIARMEERLDSLDSREDRYEAALEMLEETLHGGGRVFPDHAQVQRAARLGGVNEEMVIDDLRERNPSVPDHNFVDRTKEKTARGDGSSSLKSVADRDDDE